MGLQLFIVCCAAAGTVLAVRWLVMPGVELFCDGLGLGVKSKGQVIGYATSMPEFVVVAASAWAGVFDAGFWNIASSNIINCLLFLAAAVSYRQVLKLRAKRFRDELVFVVASVALPLALMALDVPLGAPVAGLLIGFFALYKVCDRHWNCAKPSPPMPTGAAGATARRGVVRGAILMACGVGAVTLAGRFLGSSAAVLVDRLGTPAWLVGWILGGITSLPELTSFWEIFRLWRLRRRSLGLGDTQQALDALVSSNLCNLGLILPLGIVIYILVT